jgi:hypothetical protein
MRSFENIDKGNVEAWQKRDACEVGFQHDGQTDIINAVTKQKNEEEGWESESEIHTYHLPDPLNVPLDNRRINAMYTACNSFVLAFCQRYIEEPHNE